MALGCIQHLRIHPNATCIILSLDLLFILLGIFNKDIQTQIYLTIKLKINWIKEKVHIDLLWGKDYIILLKLKELIHCEPEYAQHKEGSPPYILK